MILFQYQALAEPVFTGTIEVVTLDKWIPSYPNRLDPLKRLNGGSFLLDPFGETQKETVFLDKWFFQLPERLNRARSATREPYLSYPTFTPVPPPMVSVDMWFVQHPERLNPRALRTANLYNFTLDPFSALQHETIFIDKWLPTYPNRLDRARAATREPYYSAPVFVAEVVTLDKWFTQNPEHLNSRRPLRRTDWYDANVFPLPNPISPTTIDKWIGQYPVQFSKVRSLTAAQLSTYSYTSDTTTTFLSSLNPYFRRYLNDPIL